VVGPRWDEALPSLAAFALQAGFGTALFLRARGLALLWHRLRTAGVRPAADHERSTVEPPA
jgi:hypothetical protein